jgi:DNA-binding beta-propeller fold protein YncE
MKNIAGIKTGKNPHGVSVSPNGKFVAVSNEGENTVSIIDPVTNTCVWLATDYQHVS